MPEPKCCNECGEKCHQIIERSKPRCPPSALLCAHCVSCSKKPQKTVPPPPTMPSDIRCDSCVFIDIEFVRKYTGRERDTHTFNCLNRSITLNSRACKEHYMNRDAVLRAQKKKYS